MITVDKENGLLNQDAPAKHTDECFDGPSASSLLSKVNGSTIDDNHDSPENSEFYLEIDASLGSSQNSLMSKRNSQILDSADTSHSYICASRDSHNLDTSIDSSKSGMLYCTDSQPVVDTQLLYSNSSQPVVDATLLHSNSSFPDTENEMNNSNSTYNHEHHVDMQKVKDVLKITEINSFKLNVQQQSHMDRMQ